MLHTWVSSAGGPLLVAPQSALALWTGATGLDGPVETWGDYGRACAVDGYVGLAAVGERQALVLGDEPAMTTYLPAERLFPRWAAADEEDELVSAARRAVHGGVEWDADEDVLWVLDGPVVMFDSARPGTEMEPDNHLVVDLRPGTYRVRATYRADADNWMILVQLQPVPPSGQASSGCQEQANPALTDGNARADGIQCARSRAHIWFPSWSRDHGNLVLEPGK